MLKDSNIDSAVNLNYCNKDLGFIFDILDQIENLNLELEKEFTTEIALIFGENFAKKMTKR